MRIVASILAICLAAGPAMAAPNTCAKEEERSALDTIALKSELMVTALTCHMQEKYDAFITHYQPALSATEKDVSNYFKHAFGRRSVKEHDDYISNLANVQSEEGLKMGTAFCETYSAMFDEVESLHSSTELADFANSKALIQPVSFETCPATPAKATRHLRSKKKHTTA
jgi:hypothetical protein